MSFNAAFEGDEISKINDRDTSQVMVLKDKNGLCEDLKYILSVPDLCDVTFLVGEEKRPVHGLRAILAARSRTFYQMFLAKDKETEIKASKKKFGLLKRLKEIRKLLKSKSACTQQGHQHGRRLTIELEQYEPCVFERLVRYIHCGVVSVDVFVVIGLMIAADKFGLESLKNACWEFAVNCIRPEVVHHLIVSANQYSKHRLTSVLLQKVQQISFDQPELLYHSLPSSSSLKVIQGEQLDSNESTTRPRGITTNGLLMRSVL